MRQKITIAEWLNQNRKVQLFSKKKNKRWSEEEINALIVLMENRSGYALERMHKRILRTFKTNKSLFEPCQQQKLLNYINNQNRNNDVSYRPTD